MPRPDPSIKRPATRYSGKQKPKKKVETRERADVSAKINSLVALKEDSPDSSLGGRATAPVEYLTSRLGRIFHGDSLELLRRRIADDSIDLIMTSPPFGLVRKKDYGNVDAHDYVEWFKQFGHEFLRVLKDSGSLVIDIGGAWVSGQPTRSLYHYELLLMLCKEIGFHLAQEFFWWNPARMPTSAEFGNRATTLSLS